MTARSEKALLREAAEWVRGQREALGWSPGKLAVRTRLMQRCQGLRGPVPLKGDIIALEAGELRQLPRWLTLVEDVFAFVAIAPEHRAAWIDRRNWRYAGHPIDLSETLVFRDEAMLLDVLAGMVEDDRRAWRAVLTKWPMRGERERERLDAAREWVRRMGFNMDALTDAEQLMLKRYRQLPRDKRAEFDENIANQMPWPPKPPTELGADEMELVLGYLSADEDGRYLLHMMATNPGWMAAVKDLITKAHPPKPSGDAVA